MKEILKLMGEFLVFWTMVFISLVAVMLLMSAAAEALSWVL